MPAVNLDVFFSLLRHVVFPSQRVTKISQKISRVLRRRMQGCSEMWNAVTGWQEFSFFIFVTTHLCHIQKHRSHQYVFILTYTQRYLAHSHVRYHLSADNRKWKNFIAPNKSSSFSCWRQTAHIKWVAREFFTFYIYATSIEIDITDNFLCAKNHETNYRNFTRRNSRRKFTTPTLNFSTGTATRPARISIKRKKTEKNSEELLKLVRMMMEKKWRRKIMSNVYECEFREKRKSFEFPTNELRGSHVMTEVELRMRGKKLRMWNEMFLNYLINKWCRC